MGVNYVQLGNGETIVDLRGLTVNEDVLFEGYTAIDSKGEPVMGKASPQGGGGESASNTFIVKLLTSLSASGLSLSLPSDVTYTDLNDAVDNGLHVIAIADIPSVAGDIAGTYAIPFAYKDTSGNLIFSVMVRDMNLCVIITPSGAISFTYFFAEQSGRKIDSIHAGVSHSNYPSAKAVYDFVQSEKQVETITCDFDLLTMTISNMSHTYQQIADALNAGKQVIIRSETVRGTTLSNVSVFDPQQNLIVYQIFVMGNFDGAGNNLWYFHIIMHPDNSFSVNYRCVDRGNAERPFCLDFSGEDVARDGSFSNLPVESSKMQAALATFSAGGYLFVRVTTPDGDVMFYHPDQMRPNVVFTFGSINQRSAVVITNAGGTWLATATPR